MGKLHKCTKCNLVKDRNKDNFYLCGDKIVCQPCKECKKKSRYSLNKNCKNCNKIINNESIMCRVCTMKKPRSIETRRKITESLLKNPRKYWLGKKLYPHMIKALSLSAKRLLGKSRPLAVRIKLSIANKGENSPNWQGGKTEKNKAIRASLEYRLWRETVFTRDNYTCIWCKQRGGKLQADHIKPFALFPALRFSIDNGRTLCVPCHKKTDTYGWKTQVKNKIKVIHS